MKKIFWILIIIILFIGGWFMFVVKNPSLPIAQTILTTLGVSIDTQQEVLPSTTTGIDLSNCISYFDGCNNCTVENGKPSACTLMYCETPGEPKCNQYATGTSPALDPNCISYSDGCNTCSKSPNDWPTACTEMYCETPGEPKCNQYATWVQNPVGLANPASTNCIKNWWTLNIVTQADGGEVGQVGMCTLPDGTVCEERSYMRGLCWWTTASGDTWVSPGNPWSTPDSEWPIACTMEYAPVCASIQVECIKAPCPPIQQTFGNRCTMNANRQARFLYDGECAK